MDDDDFDYDEDDCEMQSNAHKFEPVDLLPIALGLVEGLLGALHSTAVTAYNMAARHANYCHRQAEFRREAELAIESITTTENTDG